MSIQVVPHEGVRGVPAPQPLGGALEALSATLDRLADRVVLFRYGDWVFVSFGLYGALGAFLTTALMGVILVGQGVAPTDFVTMALIGSAAVVAGSWLLGQILDYRLLLEAPWTALRRPVFVSWGGVLGFSLTLVIFAKLSGHGLVMLLDALACTIFLGHAVGRIGCLSYGCCFGRPTRCRLAIRYHDADAKAVRVGRLHGVPLHPAAFYEAVGDLALLVGINAVALHGAPLGVPTALGFLGYGSIRFGVEFLRDQDGREVVGPLSVNHLIALAVFGIGLCLAALTLGGGLGAAPPIAWSASFTAAPWLGTAIMPVGLVVFLGFSLHRGGVGRW
jgi:phosphatidylglycerol:prolipoprotein diacylglycerol transferase